MNEAKWLMTTGYVYGCFFFLLLFCFVYILFLFRYVLLNTEQKQQQQPNSEMQRPNWTFSTGSLIHIVVAGQRVGKYALIIIPQQHSTDAANLVWHHIEFCAHSFFFFHSFFFCWHARADVWTLLNIACPCVALICVHSTLHTYKSRQID